MRLTELNIRLASYDYPDFGVKKGQYFGTINYSNRGSEIKIAINPEHIDKILPLIAQALVDTTKGIADTLTTAVIDAVPLVVEDKSNA